MFSSTVDGLTVEQLITLLQWMDGHPVYADFCAQIRSRIDHLMRLN